MSAVSPSNKPTEVKAKSKFREDFDIYVEPSCLTNSTDLRMQPTAHRNDSDQTVIRHASYESVDDREESLAEGAGTESQEHYRDEEEHTGSWQEESVLSDISGVTPMSSLVSTDSHTEALIRSAAREVVAKMEAEAAAEDINEEEEVEDSLLSARTDEQSFVSETGDEDRYGEATEMSYDGTDVTGDTYESDVDETASRHGQENTTVGDGVNDEVASDADGEDEPAHDEDRYDGSASSHHSDDVFSDQDMNSKRSSLNSLSSHPQTDGESISKRELTQHDSVSRVPSNSSNAYSLLPEPLSLSSPRDYTPRTPTSKVLARPPFRTPSSVRAMQMSSPTPSVLSANTPRSSRRPTVSRLGTPSNHNTKTPTRFKVKKENPLVLLHVTCLPSDFHYASLFDGGQEISDWSKELLDVKESWRLVREKMGEMVKERGILLPHPQDDFEVLEERLLEALELPVRPRARILSCGHYVGPSCESDFSASEDESSSESSDANGGGKETWCDICGREVRLEKFGIGAGNQKRFKVKVYASNGLMRAGAWAAAWREMERVDVQIEPLVPGHLTEEMEHRMLFATSSARAEMVEEEPHVVDNLQEDIHYSSPTEAQGISEEARAEEETAALSRKEMEAERLREIYGHTHPANTTSTESQHAQEQEQPRHTRKHRQRNDEPLTELLLAALKVAMRDQKNIMIFLLSAIVLILALRPGTPKLGLDLRERVDLPQIQTIPEVAMKSVDCIYSSIVPTAVAEKVQAATAAVVDAIPSKATDSVKRGVEMVEELLQAPADSEIETNLSEKANEVELLMGDEQSEREKESNIVTPESVDGERALDTKAEKTAMTAEN